ncbi:MAG TPA: glycosyltransferase family 39 protein [Acidobacteriaceae bacterium]|jgi:4-amino-4-deoxy-L-arabinose transferase-like glycosyltransferase|nr:glycosyltransferase family 39 protein [Acidobacteriaceae bacterium]
MNVVAHDHTAQAPTQKAYLRRYVPYLVFAFCASLYLLPFMRLLLQGTDEGLLVSGAVRVAHGQVFARDFIEMAGPGTFYWVALFFKLFGVTFVAERLCLFISSLGTGLLMYFLARRICSRYQFLPCLLLAATYFGMLWPTISHHVDSNFFALLSVACMVVWQDRHKYGLLFAAGALAGATTCFLQPKGVLLFLALLLWLGIQNQQRSASWSSLGMVAGSYLGVIGLTLAYFWSQSALKDLIYANFLWPYRHYGAVNVVPYARGIFRDYWNHWITPVHGIHWTIGIAAVLIIPFLFVAALPVLLPIIGILNRRCTARPEILLYWLCGGALWLSEIHRKDITHLVFGSPLLLILCVFYIQKSRRKAADYALQILAISAACLAGLNLCVALTAHPMATRVGTVAVFKSDPVLTFLDTHTKPGEDIYLYPYSPMYYFLSDTMNPTRFSGMWYSYNTVSDFQEVVRVLDQRRVKYVVWDTGFDDRVLPLFFPSLKRPRVDQLIIEPYLESHYTQVESYNGVRIMERNSSPDSSAAR